MSHLLDKIRRQQKVTWPSLHLLLQKEMARTEALSQEPKKDQQEKKKYHLNKTCWYQVLQSATTFSSSITTRLPPATRNHVLSNHKEVHPFTHLGFRAVRSTTQLHEEHKPSAACQLFYPGPLGQSGTTQPQERSARGCFQQTRPRYSKAKYKNSSKKPSKKLALYKDTNSKKTSDKMVITKAFLMLYSKNSCELYCGKTFPLQLP